MLRKLGGHSEHSYLNLEASEQVLRWVQDRVPRERDGYEEIEAMKESDHRHHNSLLM